MKYDVVIIGAGVLGISLAYHLSKIGNLSVVVLEREGSYAHHASGLNAGMFRQLYRHPQLVEWSMRSQELWPTEVKEKHFQKLGSCIVGREPPSHHEELFELREVKVYGGGEQKNLPAVFTASDGLLDSPAYVGHLRTLTDKRNSSILFHCAVHNLLYENFQWTVTCRNGRTFHAQVVVNCAGAWINQPLAAAHRECSVQADSYARHLFVLEGFPEIYMPESQEGFYWQEEANWYLRQWSETERLVSICDVTKTRPEDYTPDPNITEQLASRMIDALPSLAERLALGKSWFCFRTYTEDKLPVWGWDSLRPNLFWLGAFGGFGMSTSFAATLDAAKKICGESVSVPVEFSPQRVQRI